MKEMLQNMLSNTREEKREPGLSPCLLSYQIQFSYLKVCLDTWVVGSVGSSGPTVGYPGVPLSIVASQARISFQRKLVAGKMIIRLVAAKFDAASIGEKRAFPQLKRGKKSQMETVTNVPWKPFFAGLCCLMEYSLDTIEIQIRKSRNGGTAGSKFLPTKVMQRSQKFQCASEATRETNSSKLASFSLFWIFRHKGGGKKKKSRRRIDVCH